MPGMNDDPTRLFAEPIAKDRVIGAQGSSRETYFGSHAPPSFLIGGHKSDGIAQLTDRFAIVISSISGIKAKNLAQSEPKESPLDSPLAQRAFCHTIDISLIDARSSSSSWPRLPASHSRAPTTRKARHPDANSSSMWRSIGNEIVDFMIG
jgi:hypothetical protein